MLMVVDRSALSGDAAGLSGEAAGLPGEAAALSDEAAGPSGAAARPSGEAAGLKGETRIEEPTRAQRTIVRRTAEARATVPDLELDTDVDMESCLRLTTERGCSITAILVRACALALRDVPYANSAYRDGRFELYSRVNVGVTIETEDAYAVPAVLDADRKSLSELTIELGVLTGRAHRGELTPPALSGATFTLTDLGDHGVARSSAIVTPPQAAALVAGAIRTVPVLRDGAIVAGRVSTLTLGCDHRILYGGRAARFLSGVSDRLQAGRL
jgi:pyruvate dehydrogenase E2 component (dihydrolipoamide acetyltransferase)